MTSHDSLHAPVREDWLALREEEILEPTRPIVDPHHHLWDRPGARHLFPELLADMNAGHDVRATVYVQCRSMYRASGPEELRPVGEVEFVNGIAAQAASGIYGEHYACSGIVGFADLTAKAFEPVFLAGTLPLLLLAYPSVEASTVAEVIALAKSTP